MALADVRLKLADEWAEFVEDRPGDRREWTQDQRWRADNPGQFQQLLAYRAGGTKPDLGESGTGARMVKHLEAWHLTAEAPDPPPSGAKLVAQAVYEGYADVSDVPLWKTHGEQAKADDRLRIVDDPLGQRGKVMRVEVRSGDSAVAGSGSGERADVMASASAVPMREGTILAVSLPIMLPNEFNSNSSGWNVPIGGHDAAGGTQSPVQFEIRDGKDLRLRLLGGVKQPGGLGTWRADLAIASLGRNRWYELVWGFVFSSDPTKGRVVVRLDGATKIDQACANLYEGSYNYHKQGWYRVAQSSTTVLFMDSTHFWTAPTLADALRAAEG